MIRPAHIKSICNACVILLLVLLCSQGNAYLFIEEEGNDRSMWAPRHPSPWHPEQNTAVVQLSFIETQEDSLSEVDYVSKAKGAARAGSGKVGEEFTEYYFAQQGWKVLKGGSSNTGVDHVFYKVNQNGSVSDVMIVESKTNGSSLRPTKTKGYQMTKRWILKSLGEQEARLNKKIAACSDEVQRKALEEEKKRLAQVIERVKKNNYRPRMVKIYPRDGFLNIDIIELEKVSKNGNSAPKQIRKRGWHVNLHEPEKNGKILKKLYDKYFESKERAIALALGDEEAAKRIVDNLKKMYTEQKNCDEYAFIVSELEKWYKNRASESIVLRALPKKARDFAIKLMEPLCKARAVMTAKALAGATETWGRAFFVADIAVNVYLEYSDFSRWRVGEISAKYFAFKTGLRIAESALAYYTLFGPDPTWITKIVAGVATGTLMVLDIASDEVLSHINAEYIRLLRDIDRDAQYEACRSILLSEGAAL